MTLKQKEVGKNFIEHFGVKGMRWGVRRSKAAIAKESGGEKGGAKAETNKKKAPEKKSSSDGNSRSPTKSVQEMSDKELQSYVNRLNMEQQYARMQPTPLTRRAAKFVTDIAVNVAKQQITNQLNAEIGKQIGLAKTKKSKAPAIQLIKPPTGPRLG